jgi:hypothetical protein
MTDPTPRTCGLCGRTHPTSAPEVESASLFEERLYNLYAQDLDAHDREVESMIEQRDAAIYQRAKESVDARLATKIKEALAERFTESQRNEFALEFGYFYLEQLTHAIVGNRPMRRDVNNVLTEFLAQRSDRGEQSKQRSQGETE